MIPLAHITAWRETAPWADDAQVEQDLARAVVQLFESSAISSSFVLRGGTALHKLMIHPASRYSEDIDLVQTTPGPIGSLVDIIRKELDSWLGKPKRSSSENGVTLTWKFELEIPPVRPLRLKVEINTREHFTIFGLTSVRFDVENPWFSGSTEIATFQHNELFATKLRALYQRKKGRDLFDLWLGLARGFIDPEQVIACFQQYMQREGHTVTRKQFEHNLNEKQLDTGFLNDIRPLLRSDIEYDPIVRDCLVARIES